MVAGVYNKVKTSQLDDLAAETAAYMTVEHPEYSQLAARITISNMHKMTSDRMDVIFPFLDETTTNFIRRHWEPIHKALNFERDFEYEYFGVKTLMKSYLMRDHETNEVVELIQIILMRDASGINAPSDDLDNSLQCYKLMSDKYYTHATPTMFNAGTPFAQLASCFLLRMVEDSIDGIFGTLKRCAIIQSMPEASVYLSATYVPKGLLFVVRMEGRMDWLPCRECTMRWHVTSTRVGGDARVRSRFIWNHGTRIFSHFLC